MFWEIFWTVIGIIVAIVVLLGVLYMCVLVRPRARKPRLRILLCNYAHRGLHDKSAPENSLAAFELACKAHFGIELDVQLSYDGQVMVFHDDTLLRMTGCKNRVREVKAEDLKKLSLAGTKYTIPTLEEVLELVNCRVPLLIELKGEDLDVEICEKVANILEKYPGAYCIESFNPLLLHEMRQYLPQAFYGQLYTNVCRDKKKKSLLNMLLTAMAFNFLSKPDFIAYNQEDRDAFPVRVATELYHAHRFTWTVRSYEEIKLAHELGECAIFEREEKKQ